ncbi:hypothetical protein WJX84_010182 [Apatococcus fuscideae]|uniref:Prenyl transferase n=1 Tax=Apatococcus fuscideae TaxID=2026836 RepID=A0AAW1T5I1_9CHLO
MFSGTQLKTLESISSAGSVEATNLSREVEGNGLSPTVSTHRILDPVKADMQILHDNLVRIGEKRHPKLGAATRQIFGGGGKRLRPAIVLLVARATCQLSGLSDITDRHRRLAEITEMIHTASLVHDDVLDDCSLRRGQPTVNNIYGTRTAVLAGDYLFAQSSWLLARLQNFEVIELISMVIADFATGEISQSDSLFDVDLSLEQYMDKNFYKTASLIASSCRSSAVFSAASSEVKDAMFEYGRHLGLAFQIVDDILDFTQSTEQLGKPQVRDLASGNLTAPAIYALTCEGGDRLRELIETDCTPASTQESDLALAALDCLPESRSKESLQQMVGYVLDRLY